MISFLNIHKQYGKQLVFVDASFQLNPGEKVGLVGPNGAGKTTLFRMIVGDEYPDEGEVAVPRKLTIGYFRQDVEEMHGRSVLDEAIAGSDALATSAVLAAALGRVGFDLVIAGAEATDARTGVMAAMLAERLGVPQLTLASKVDIDGAQVTVRRASDEGVAVVTGVLPAVVSVLEKINEPRYPSFKGIMAAKKKPVQVLTLAELGVAADGVGLAGSVTEVTDFAARPPRAAGVVVPDEGEGGAKVAACLAERKFI